MVKRYQKMAEGVQLQPKDTYGQGYDASAMLEHQKQFEGKAKKAEKLHVRGNKTRQIVILGLRGSGKSFYAKNEVIERHRKDNMIVVDSLNEYKPKPGLIVYQLSDRSEDGKWEVETLIRKYLLPKSGTQLELPEGKKFKWLVIDEAEFIYPVRKPLPPAINDVVRVGRHYGINCVFITHRPSNMNTDIIELSDEVVIFALKGKNDLDYLNRLSKGLDGVVQSQEEYEYTTLDIRGLYQKHRPIKPAKKGKR